MNAKIIIAGIGVIVPILTAIITGLFGFFTKPDPSVCNANNTKVGGSVIMNCGNSGSTRHITKIDEINPQHDLEQN